MRISGTICMAQIVPCGLLITAIFLVLITVTCKIYPKNSGSNTSTVDSQTYNSDDLEGNIDSELVTMANFPVHIAFTPDGRLFYNEFQTGNINIFSHGEISLFTHIDIFSMIECGLLGIAIDPDFVENHYIYVYFVEPVEKRNDIGHPVIVRFTEVDGKAHDPEIIVADLPNTNPIICGHVAGGLNFGPDGFLYFSIGEMEFKDPAQDLNSSLGKIHRINKKDGSAAPGNPFINKFDADHRIYAFGLRNTFDFTFHPITGDMYGSENGLGNCDELNLIKPGGNYGHPISSFEQDYPKCLDRFGVKPIYLYSKPGIPPEVYPSNVAPTGLQFVSSEVYPNIGDALLTCEWITGYMRRILFDDKFEDKVIDDSILTSDCRLDIVTDPNGVIYYSNPREIRRLIPTH